MPLSFTCLQGPPPAKNNKASDLRVFGLGLIGSSVWGSQKNLDLQVQHLKTWDPTEVCASRKVHVPQIVAHKVPV